ncbi:MAG: monofunctional biosynthetic peptidoglycan transglycosylase, partial [Pseudorhodoplanes sp.]
AGSPLGATCIMSRPTAREAALTAAMLPNPRRRDAAKPGPAVRRLSGIYQRRANMVGLDACLRRPRGS